METKIPTHISLISSSISGGIHIIVGHPFDTIKNILQGKNRFNYSGLFKLYRGLKYPLIQNTFSNSVTFGFNNYFNSIINNPYLGNFYTALISTFILTPFDKYKVMSQYNKSYTASVKNIVYSYKNLPIISVTEIPSTFVYFSVYHKLKELNYSTFTSGGMAGLCSWVSVYPLDTIKVRLLSETSTSFKQAYKQGNLFRGIYVCMFRSVLVNGVNFYCYEKLNKLFMSKLS